MVPFIMWRRRQTFLTLKLKCLLNEVVHFSTNVILNLLQTISAFQPSDAAEDCRTRSVLTVDLLSMGLMMNFLSLKEMFRISLQGNPIFGVILEEGEKSEVSQVWHYYHMTYHSLRVHVVVDWGEWGQRPPNKTSAMRSNTLLEARGKGGRRSMSARSLLPHLQPYTVGWNHWFFDSLVLLLVDVQSLTVDSQPQLRALLVPDFKVVEAVHVQVLGDLQVLNHRLFPAQENRGSHTSWNTIFYISFSKNLQ